MQLNKHWDKLQQEKGNVNIHVVVPGNKKEIDAMKQELGLNFDVVATDLRFHREFELVAMDEQSKLHPLRGYAIVKDGKVIYSTPDNTAGERSEAILEEAKK